MNENQLKELQELLLSTTGIRLGRNKINELSRLVFEISIRERVSFKNVLEYQSVLNVISAKGLSPLDRFSKVKKAFLEIRYPNAIKHYDFSVYFNELLPAAGTKKTSSGAFVPEKILIQEDCRQTKLAQRALSMFPAVRPEYFKDIKSYQKTNSGSGAGLKKRDLVITNQRWDFVKPCPCTQKAVSCGYHIINLGFGCPFDCTYCFLQQYSNIPGILLDANIEDFLSRIDEYLSKSPQINLRIGTGEFTDSLALDHITEYSKTLVPYFADKNTLFELKTKSANINNLIGLNHNGKTVVSWSLNPESIINSEENGTANLKERLTAAKKCFEQGYKIGFHFDPIIHFKGWESEYEKVVNRLFDEVKDVQWISLGTFRSNRMIKTIIESRFPDTKYIYGELIIGPDKKIRYYSELRKEIYKKMAGWIRKRNRKTMVYLCMEPKNTWDGVI